MSCHELLQWRQRAFDGLTILFAASIPFIQVFWKFPFVSYIMALWGLLWLMEGRFIARARKSLNPLLLVFAGLYLFHLVGLIHTENMANGRADIILKLPLILCPLVFFTSEISSKVLRLCLGAFVLCAFVGTVFCLVKVAAVPGPLFIEQLSYKYLSANVNLHPAIFAMYLGFAVAALTHLYFTTRSQSQLGLVGLLVSWLWFGCNIILLSSRVGLIVLALLGMLGIIVLVLHRRWIAAGLVAVTAMITVVTAPSVFGPTVSRLQDVIGGTNVHSARSTAVRTSLWARSWHLIKQHPLVGVGTGDVEDVLVSKPNDTEATITYTHAHNQFIQTTVALGLPGGVLLLISVLWPLVLAVKQRLWLFAVFLTTAVAFMTFDSILETQSGLIFYAFFNAMLASRIGMSRNK